jgi:hypothetical protein
MRGGWPHRPCAAYRGADRVEQQIPGGEFVLSHEIHENDVVDYVGDFARRDAHRN